MRSEVRFDRLVDVALAPRAAASSATAGCCFCPVSVGLRSSSGPKRWALAFLGRRAELAEREAGQAAASPS